MDYGTGTSITHVYGSKDDTYHKMYQILANNSILSQLYLLTGNTMQQFRFSLLCLFILVASVTTTPLGSTGLDDMQKQCTF